MKKNSRFTSGLLVSAVLLGLAGFSFIAAQQPTSPPTDLYGQPLKLRDLTDLGPILDAKTTLTPLQATEVLVHWLVQERKQPTPTFTGISGAPIDSGYIQKQIAWSMGLVGDPKALKWLQAQSIDPALRNVIGVALGIAGDHSQAEALRTTLRSDENPYMRDLAVMALVKVGDVDSRKDLRDALKDSFSVKFKPLHAPPGDSEPLTERTIYPVRDSAKKALELLERPAVIDDARSRAATYEDKVKAMSTYVAENQAGLQEILKRATAK